MASSIRRAVAPRHLEQLLTLGLIIACLVLALALAGVHGIGTGGVDTAVTITAPLDAEKLGERLSEPLPPGVELAEEHSARITLANPSFAEHLLFRTGPALAAALAIAVLFLLRAIVGSVDRGEPFIATNVRRLRVLAIALAVGGIAVEIVGELTREALIERSQAADLWASSFTLGLWPLLAGLVVAVLAEVFRHGARLREDVEGLV